MAQSKISTHIDASAINLANYYRDPLIPIATPGEWNRFMEIVWENALNGIRAFSYSGLHSDDYLIQANNLGIVKRVVINPLQNGKKSLYMECEFPDIPPGLPENLFGVGIFETYRKSVSFERAWSGLTKIQRKVCKSMNLLYTNIQMAINRRNKDPNMVHIKNPADDMFDTPFDPEVLPVLERELAKYSLTYELKQFYSLEAMRIEAMRIEAMLVKGLPPSVIDVGYNPTTDEFTVIIL